MLRSHRLNAQRRSQRVLLSIPILVSGYSAKNYEFTEDTVTAVVSAHGALILLAHIVQVSQLLTIRNLKSTEELQCKVIEVGAKRGTKLEVGLEFIEASPRFWRVAFPPDDWSPRSPEAKQYAGRPLSFPKRAPTK